MPQFGAHRAVKIRTRRAGPHRAQEGLPRRHLGHRPRPPVAPLSAGRRGATTSATHRPVFGCAGRGVQVAVAGDPATQAQGTAPAARPDRKQAAREARTSPGASMPVPSLHRASRPDIRDRRNRLPFLWWADAAGGAGEGGLQHPPVPAEPGRANRTAADGSGTRATLWEEPCAAAPGFRSPGTGPVRHVGDPAAVAANGVCSERQRPATGGPLSSTDRDSPG